MDELPCDLALPRRGPGDLEHEVIDIPGTQAVDRQMPDRLEPHGGLAVALDRARADAERVTVEERVEQVAERLRSSSDQVAQREAALDLDLQSLRIAAARPGGLASLAASLAPADAVADGAVLAVILRDPGHV
mgnify:CR=1 FL=1